MSDNTSLARARKAKNDEFYTLYDDIAKELAHYDKYLEDKIVYCNCDNPFKSNFVKYFMNNFEKLHLKELRASCWSGEPSGVHQRSLFGDSSDKFQDASYLRITRETLSKGIASSTRLLKGNGDFRSKECIGILEESDVVITNPPFSLFREELKLIFDKGKECLLLGNMNAIAYTDIFPLIMEKKLWVGYKTLGIEMLFNVPEDYEEELRQTKTEGGGWRRRGGITYGRVASACWFTNLGTIPSRAPITLTRTYDETYEYYDNYNALNIPQVQDIPKDFNGIMGVPITFLGKCSAKQFELVGLANHGTCTGYDFFEPILHGKKLFKRLLIRNIGASDE